MKVDDIAKSIGNIHNIESYMEKKANSNDNQSVKHDKEKQLDAKINISNTSVEYGKVADAMNAVPVERARKIEELKHQVEHNQYHVNAQHIADKILSDLYNE